MATIKDLNAELASKNYQPIYIFTGEESGLITQYVNDIKSQFKNVIETSDINQIIEDVKYNSIFGGRKLYILRETGLFNKQADEKFIELLVKLYKQKSHVCLFVETDINKTYKQTQSVSDKAIVEFKKLSEEQLIALVTNVLSQNNRKMLKDVTRYFVDQCDYDYNTIMNELTKVLNYSETKDIKVDDLKVIISQSTRSIVFDLVDFIVKQRYQRALDMYRTLLNKKESPLVILTLIYRQLKLLYQIKLLTAQGYKVNDIAEACDSKPFIIDKSMRICDFNTDKLLKLMTKCADMDWKIKTGQIKDTLAIEYIILYSSIK